MILCEKCTNPTGAINYTFLLTNHFKMRMFNSGLRSRGQGGTVPPLFEATKKCPLTNAFSAPFFLKLTVSYVTNAPFSSYKCSFSYQISCQWRIQVGGTGAHALPPLISTAPEAPLKKKTQKD